VPDYYNYLVYILVHPLPDIKGGERSVAGYILSSAIRFNPERINVDSLNYVKDTVFTGLEDQDPEIRKAAANLIPWLFRQLGTENWPGALTTLMTYIDGAGMTQDVRSLAFTSRPN
jgi:hypothetical protein